MGLKNTLLGMAGFGAGLAAYSLIRRREEIQLRGRTVLITGGSRGLGLQLAREFGGEGCQVVLCARDSAELERARVDLVGRGIRVHTIQCDITRRDQVENAVAETIAHFGCIDVLVNNAGVIQVAPIEEMTVEDFEDAMAVMFWGGLYAIMAALPHMRQRREGRIVNVTSIAGKVSIPHLVPYSCAKFAAVALSQGLRAELASYGIKVITIIPGLMRTGSHLNAEFKGDHRREYTWFSLGAATPLLSISAERAARSIVRSTKLGEAEKILSIPADLLARLNGALPEVTTPLLEWVDRFLLPEPPPYDTGLRTGAEARAERKSAVLDAANTMGDAAAGRLNEVPMASY